MDYFDILQKIAVPRPNHMEAVDRTAGFLQDLLGSWGVPFDTQEFLLRYHMPFLSDLTVLVLLYYFLSACLNINPGAIHRSL